MFPCKFAIKTKLCHALWNEKLHNLTEKRYAALIIDLNEYLESFPKVALDDKIGVTKLNKILLNSMPDS